MDNTTLKNIFKFLEDEGEHKAPFKWKLENNIPLSKEELEVEHKKYLNMGYIALHVDVSIQFAINNLEHIKEII